MQYHCKYDELKDPDLLTPHPRNYNKHPERQIEMLAKIINHTGYRHSVVVSKSSGYVVAGHGRIDAAKKLGCQVPVTYQDFKNEAEEFEFLVADNKIAELAAPDENLIIEGIKELEIEDFELLGLENFELPHEPEEAQCDEDDVPENVETRCKPGDIWTLGSHRLLCGDATNIDHVQSLMNGDKADMVFTDPPYNVSYGQDNANNSGGWSKSNRPIMNDSMSSDEYSDFCHSWISLIPEITDGCVYIWGPPGPDGRILFTTADKVLHCSTTVVWKKDSLVLGRGKYQNKYEPCWFGWVDSGKLFIDDRKLTNVWEFDRPKKSDLHPTMKPVELCENGLNHASKKSVADLFGGSGSTMIAAEKTGRKCYMMELDPHYCDVILSRWEKYTGKEAKLET